MDDACEVWLCSELSMWIIWQVRQGLEKEFVRKLSKKFSRKTQHFIVLSLVSVTPVSSSSFVCAISQQRRPQKRKFGRSHIVLYPMSQITYSDG